jgi:uncharacterized repeat protein (TIGR01451 family)
MKILIIFLTAIASVLETGFLILSLGLRGIHAETRFLSSGFLPLSLGLRGIHAETRFLSASENQPRVELKLTVDRRVIIENIENETGGGEPEFEWQPLSPETQVLPGDILRYRLVGKNNGSQPVSSLVLTQPIPPEMIYILGSAKGANNITFSIDNGVTFDANPMITSVNNRQGGQAAAPPENYTHVRWNFDLVLAPAEEFVGSFEVRVR